MESVDAVEALSALAHPGRLAVFRLVVRAGPDGMKAGEIARQAGTLPNTLSSSLTILNAAGLVSSRREGRFVLYNADLERMAALTGFLVQDCCGGRPEVCTPLAQVLAQVSCTGGAA